jgi:hypothetical protein
MDRCLASIPLLILLSGAVCSSQQTDIDYNKWPGQFGELVRLLEGQGRHGGGSPQDQLRIIELLEAQKQLGEAINHCRDLTSWSDDFKKEPWVGLLRRKTLELEKKIASSSSARGLSAGVLARLKAKLPSCHIQELDLPAVYRQAASENRLHDCFLSTETHDRLAAEYPILTNHLSLERFWKSEDGQTVGVLAYHSLGPLLLYSQDGGRQWLGPFYLGLHRLPHYAYLILPDSKLPLIDSQRVQLEVAIWARDHSQPGGGLMGYKYLWKKWHKLLLVPLDAIAKDSDVDGLTDLFEERILTDPNSSDSDNDGWNDAVDNQPLVPKPRDLSEADRILLKLVAD